MFALLAALLASQDAGIIEETRADVSVSHTQVALGEPFELTVRIQHPAALRFELKDAADTAVFERQGVDRQREDGTPLATTTFRVSLQGFETGTHRLPPLDFRVTGPRSTEDWSLDGPDITVQSGLNAQSADAPHPPKPPVDVPVPSDTALWVALAALAAGLLGWLLYRRWSRPRPPAPVPVIPPLPLLTRTQAALDALEAERLPERGLARPFHFQLSDILRVHLGERYGVDARECTSAELLATLAAHTPAFQDVPRETLAALLDASDLVKFARQPASPQDCAAALTIVRDIVERTAPPVAAPAVEGPT